MPEPLPARFDRAALERIIQRAAELQTGERDVGDQLSAEEVQALGKEVGIAERYLHQAILEEGTRTLPAQASGVLDRAVGLAEVRAERVIAGTEEAVEQFLLAHMEREELLQVQRQQRGRVTWVQMRGWQAAMKRGMTSAKPYHLRLADLVAATVTPLEPGYVHVALTASLRERRTAYIGGGAGVASTGAAGTAVLLALGAFPPVALTAAAAGAAAGWFIARLYRPLGERAQLGLEVVLDQLERGATKPQHQLPARGSGLLELVTTELRKALEAPRKGG